jgi:hypothetical protein
LFHGYIRIKTLPLSNNRNNQYDRGVVDEIDRKAVNQTYYHSVFVHVLVTILFSSIGHIAGITSTDQVRRRKRKYINRNPPDLSGGVNRKAEAPRLAPTSIRRAGVKVVF